MIALLRSRAYTHDKWHRNFLREYQMLADDGRVIFHWRGNTEELADVVAANVEIYNDGGNIVALDGTGALLSVNRAGLHARISEAICGVRLVKNGTGYQREYFSYQFAPTPHPGPPQPNQPVKTNSEPNDKVLDDIYRSLLLTRLPKVG